MVKFVYIVLFGILFPTLSACYQNSNNKYSVICDSFQCVEENKNKYAIIHGLFQEYTPYNEGKGAGNKFWEFEILLNDGLAVPIKTKEKKYKKFVGKKVVVKCLIYYGVIIGEDDGESQNATGFRIDIDQIDEND